MVLIERDVVMQIGNFLLRPGVMLGAIAASAAAGLGGGVALAGSVDTTPITRAMAPAARAVAQGGTHASLADMIQSVSPSVVQIQVKPRQDFTPLARSSEGSGDLRDRLGELFGFAPDEPDSGQRGPAERGALGSGFIISSDGLVLTNNHVVDGATSVTVQLSDGRELPGRVLGRDPKTDVAVVRIAGHGSFTPVRWGDSDHIRVGDSVFAVGSPFGLGNTVTSGILSARGREIGAGPYDDFLQVDAAINSGNSGGPLFDATGRVVGINTAIFSPSGGNVGIGFAIPAATARKVAAQIASHGSVRRGRIGVSLQNITPDVAEQLGLPSAKGALIAAIDPEGPASAAGLASGDVVRAFAGRSIDDSRDLARAVADARIGSRVPLTVLRQGQRLSLAVPIIGDGAARS